MTALTQPLQHQVPRGMVRALDLFVLLTIPLTLIHWIRQHGVADPPLLAYFLERIGLARPGFLAELGLGLAISALVMGGIFLVDWAVGVIRVEGVVAPDLATLRGVGKLIFHSVLEEVLYRGFLLHGLLLVYPNPWVVVPLTALYFGFLHATNPHASPLSVLCNSLGGLIYGIALVITGGLWLPIGLHIGWNVVQALLGFRVSGYDFGRLVRQVNVGSNLWTGGGYGPEGSLIGVASRFVAIALILAAW